MGEFYGKKIQSGEINPKTGESWTINDVPKFWKQKTIDWLRDHPVES